MTRIQIPAEPGIFLPTTASRPALEPTQSTEWVLGLLSLGVKWPGLEDHSPPLVLSLRMIDIALLYTQNYLCYTLNKTI
jgi:hypothetical protein